MKFLNNINPFLKCISIVITSIILSFTYSITINITTFLVSLVLVLIFSEVKIKTVFKLFIPAILTALGLYFTGAIFGEGTTTEHTVSLTENMYITSSYNELQLATRVLAFFGLGILFSLTTNPLLFVYSLMTQGNLSPKFAYGVLASLNLLPNIKEEYENARFALEARAIYFQQNPFFLCF